ncbi:VCBS repeat-containing protein [Micromonospora sp. NPDC049523]|uniref:FG-GAP repeat domain-containing protein n=1 Tax=Micromonospora sp. NPDC049523 TaxID=3155921 RepID=UPI00341FC96F
MLAAALTAAALGTVAVAPASARPPTPLFEPAIEPYAVYDGQDTCDPTAKPGVVTFKNMLVDTYGSETWGIGRDCSDGGTSEHKEGRALDYGFDYNNPADRAEATDLLNWLLATDQYGNRHAMARRLGLMYIIWNRQQWKSYEASSGWQGYSCDGSANDCHTNHIHFSFSWPGARQQTTWWTDDSSPDSPILVRDMGSATTVLHRWGSTGASFTGRSTATYSPLDLANVNGRVAAGDFNGDGKDDTLMAHQNSDGAFSFKVLPHGTVAPTNWHTTPGPFDLEPSVGNRLIVGDFIGTGEDGGASEPILVRDVGSSTIVLYRWGSTGSSFTGPSTATYYNFDLAKVGDRVAAGDVNGDGKDDTVMAYQNTNGTFTYKVFLNGTIAPVDWYTTPGPFDLDPSVGGRLVVGDFNGDGKAEPILVRDIGSSTIVLYRWFSSGSSFTGPSTATYYSLDLANVGERVAAGDVNRDGFDDTVMAYQNSDGTLTYKVFLNGTIAPANWYTSGPFSLDPSVGGRLVLGSWL